jgi:hypothetical protein
MAVNSYDGDTLQESIAQMEILTDKRAGLVIVDKAGQGAQLTGTHLTARGADARHEGDE